MYFVERAIALETTNSYSDKNNALTNPGGFALKGKKTPARTGGQFAEGGRPTMPGRDRNSVSYSPGQY